MMTTTNNFDNKSIYSASLAKRMLLGGAIGLALITLFVSGVKNADPSWGKFWMVRPLVVVSLAGAGGGLFFYFMDRISNEGGWKKILAYFISFIGFIVALWLGAVLGLNGTLWN